MVAFLIFIIVAYTLAFVVVYKKPLVTKPIEWLFNFVGLKNALTCMICMPFYTGLFLSAINILLFPELQFTPMISINVLPETWLHKLLYIGVDGFVASGAGYLIHSMQEYFENNSQEWTEEGDSPDINNNLLLG